MVPLPTKVWFCTICKTLTLSLTPWYILKDCFPQRAKIKRMNNPYIQSISWPQDLSHPGRILRKTLTFSLQELESPSNFDREISTYFFKNQVHKTWLLGCYLDLLWWSFCNIYKCWIMILYTWNIMLYGNYTSLKKCDYLFRPRPSPICPYQRDVVAVGWVERKIPGVPAQTSRHPYMQG